MDVSGQHHALAALPPGKKTRNTLDSRLDGHQRRSERVVRKRNHIPSQESNSDRPARSLVTIVTELPRIPLSREYFTKFYWRDITLTETKRRNVRKEMADGGTERDTRNWQHWNSHSP
jgi:hypothetical protein